MICPQCENKNMQDGNTSYFRKFNIVSIKKARCMRAFAFPYY